MHLVGLEAMTLTSIPLLRKEEVPFELELIGSYKIKFTAQRSHQTFKILEIFTIDWL